MATIQVRDISDEAYETIKRRAKAAGQSIQAYMKAQIEAAAREPSKDELWDRIRENRRRAGVKLDREQLLDDIRSGRERDE